jgi:hypothetical protein
MYFGICKNCRHRWYNSHDGHLYLWCLAKKKEEISGFDHCNKYQEAKGYEKHTLQILEEILAKEKQKYGKNT